jgi:hypothetical protein
VLGAKKINDRNSLSFLFEYGFWFDDGIEIWGLFGWKFVVLMMMDGVDI